MTTRDVLAEIQARADKATEGRTTKAKAIEIRKAITSALGGDS